MTEGDPTRLLLVDDEAALREPLAEYLARQGFSVTQSASAAEHSHEEHAAIVAALAARDEERAVALMQSHLEHVEASLAFDRKRPASDLAAALTT